MPFSDHCLPQSGTIRSYGCSGVSHGDTDEVTGPTGRREQAHGLWSTYTGAAGLDERSVDRELASVSQHFFDPRNRIRRVGTQLPHSVLSTFDLRLHVGNLALSLRFVC